MVRDSSPTPNYSSKVGHSKSKEALSKDDKATPPKLALLDTFNGNYAKLKAHLA